MQASNRWDQEVDGQARFAYTPLIPSLIHARWFSASDVVYLGAANLVGYLIGALIGRPLAQRTQHHHKWPGRR